MVISDQHRYVFIEVPQTASSALAAELIENYAGRRIFRKHTDYMHFHRFASNAERSYRVLATVRNPLDIVVSKYIKARDDHRNAYGSTGTGNVPFGHRFRPEAREFAYIARHGSTFEGYVRKFYRHVYNNRACLLPENAHVMRYERLNEDFAGWLAGIGLELIRPLPYRHVTDGRKRDYSEWYQEGMRKHAVEIFGPYMLHWDYEFPSEWPRHEPSRLRNLVFKADSSLRRLYFRRIHYGWVMPSAKRVRRDDLRD